MRSLEKLAPGDPRGLRGAVRQYGLAWLFVVGAFAVVAAFYDRMPDRVPTHWNARGEIDGYMSKPWGPLVGPLAGLGLVALLSVLPRVSPEKFTMERFRRAWAVIVTALAAFLFAVTLAVTLVGAGIPVDVPRVIGASIGVLFLVLGNFMGKLTPNFFAGIRTPWTLSNEEVWLRTHRLGGKLFFAAGAAGLVGALLRPEIGVAVILVGAVVAGVVPVAYSYVLWRRLEAKT